jgi:uncharacterized membrane protein YbjE (DUF340 family)
MEAFSELLLAGALGLGLALGRVWPFPARCSALTRACILLLVGALGVTLASEPSLGLLQLLLPALGAAVAMLAVAVLVVRGVRRPRADRVSAPSEPRTSSPWALPAAIVAGVVIGYLVGTASPGLRAPAGTAVEVFLLALLFLVGWEAKLELKALRELPLPFLAGLLASAAGAVVLFLLTGEPWRVAFASTLAFGWYTLAGPAVAQAVSPVAGTLAFLVNFLREDLTMVSAPWVGRWAGAPAIAASGGATSMDTTLYFVTRYGRRDAAALALAVGTLFTLLAPVLLALLLA